MNIVPGPEMTGKPPSSAPSLAATLRGSALVVGAVFLAWSLNSLLLEAFLAVLLALLLHGLATLLSRLTRMPFSAALALLLLGLVSLAVLGVYYWGPRFTAELQSLYDHLVPEVTALRAKYAGTIWERALPRLLRGSGGGGQTPIPTLSVLGSTFGLLAATTVVLLAAIYMAAAPRMYIRGVVLLFPLTVRRRAETILYDCGRALQWWMVGQAVSMAAVGIIATVGLLILGVPLPFALGLLAGLLTFIPYVGAWLGSIPAILMALAGGPYRALWTALVFLLCHLVEGYLLSPIVQRRTVDLPPALTLLAMTMIGYFYGILGLVLATPLAAVFLVLIQEGYIAAVLGDPAMQGAGATRPGGQPPERHHPRPRP